VRGIILYFHCFGNMKTSYAVDSLAAFRWSSQYHLNWHEPI